VGNSGGNSEAVSHSLVICAVLVRWSVKDSVFGHPLKASPLHMDCSVDRRERSSGLVQANIYVLVVAC
jgi:hypothetical protein